MLVLVNAMGRRCTTDYLTECTLLVSPPKLRDGPIGLGFNNERGHDEAD
jgi:hypothetical protein